MAEIKKIKVDGVEYDIGSNLGAELEWKLVASGTITKEDGSLIYIENVNVELGKQYALRIENNCLGGNDIYNLLFLQEYDNVPKIMLSDQEYFTTRLFNLTQNEKRIELTYYSSEEEGNGFIYNGDEKFELYELAIKNVENPSNVVTPNKLKLYTTGTLYEKYSSDTEVCYILNNQLQSNKLYYVERYDCNTDFSFNCIIKTDNNSSLKCVSRMLSIESENDEIVETNIYISLENDVPILFNINGIDNILYRDPEDTLEIYELPFEF